VIWLLIFLELFFMVALTLSLRDKIIDRRRVLQTGTTVLLKRRIHSDINLSFWLVADAETKAAIDALVAGAPQALDTLNELAALLDDHPRPWYTSKVWA
jgi:hypothetical protein